MNLFIHKYWALLLLVEFVVLSSPSIADCSIPNEDNINIYFDSPANNWNEAIPIGNGSIGGMVYGGICLDTIKLNEETLWSGGPRNLQNQTARYYLPQIRELLLENKTLEAQELIDSYMLGPYNECFLPAGDLVLKMYHDKSVTNYRRELDLSNGVVTIEYSCDGVDFKREIFASNPDSVIVVRFSANKPGQISFASSLHSLLRNDIKIDKNQIVLNGKAQSHSFLHRKYRYYDSNEDDNLFEKYPEYEEGRGMRFQIRALVRQNGGTSKTDSNYYEVLNANEVELLITVATSYNGFDKDPVINGKDNKKLCQNRIEKVSDDCFQKLIQNHIRDFSLLFNRVTLNLGATPKDTIPLPKRLKMYQEDKDDLGLLALYFNFGRYLLISSSRPGGQPANLQGIWSRSLTPGWSANWTLNHNVQINYWPAEICNLSECHLPLIELTKELRPDGKKTAESLYGCRGWIAHHNTDIWRTTWPTWGTGQWAIYQIGSAWLCHHMWQHYEFSLDPRYLEEVYPYMKDAAIFYMDNLQRDKRGYLVTSPSISLENKFTQPDGTIGWACMGSSEDMQVIRDLFQNCISAATILELDSKFIKDLNEYLRQFPPIRISPTTGRLQEWNEDWVATYDNRQVSHGWGLHVGNQISPSKTPDLANAYKKTLEYKKPWEILAASWCGSISAMSWVRLGDGNMAQKVFDKHFETAVFPNMTSKFDKFWQIDGNFGITACIAEMLLQSHLGDIELLPALPDKYSTGEVKGLCARGGFVVDIKWENHKLCEIKVRSNYNNTCNLRYQSFQRTLTMKAGEEIVLNKVLKSF